MIKSNDGSQDSPGGASKLERRLRRLWLLHSLYGRDYMLTPLNYSAARRHSIAKGHGTPSVPELLAGAGFYSDDYNSDLRRFCRIVLRYENILRQHFNDDRGDLDVNSARLRALDNFLEELRRVQSDVQYDAASRIHEALRMVELHSDGDHYREAFAQPEFEHRLQFYLACANDYRAQANTAQLCLDAARTGLTSGAELRALSCAIAWFERSGGEHFDLENDDNFLSGPEMLVEGNSFFSTLSPNIKIEELAALFFTNSHELTEFIEKLQELEPEKDIDSAKDLTNPTDNKSGSGTAESHDKPSLVVFTAVNSREHTNKIYGDLINKPLQLIQPPDIFEARRRLLGEFPHAKSVIDILLRDACNHRDKLGRSIIRIKPTILVGDPGSGKSYFARKIGEVLSLPRLFFACAAVQDPMFGSSNKKWSNAEPALPVERLAFEKVANLLIILDEIEKTGTRRDHGRLHDVILNMVEPSTAADYFDQCLSSTVNLSALNWLCTANSLDGISAPLRDRFRVLTFPNPEVDHLATLLPSVLRMLSRERYGDERWAETLNESEIEKIKSIWKGGSIRSLSRVVEAVLDAREQYQRTIMN